MRGPTLRRATCLESPAGVPTGQLRAPTCIHTKASEWLTAFDNSAVLLRSPFALRCGPSAVPRAENSGNTREQPTTNPRLFAALLPFMDLSKVLNL